jgi:hypothetical protein
MISPTTEPKWNNQQNNSGRNVPSRVEKYANAIAVGDSNDTLQLTPNVRCAAATIQPMEIDDFPMVQHNEKLNYDSSEEEQYESSTTDFSSATVSRSTSVSPTDLFTTSTSTNVRCGNSADGD